MFFQNKNFAFYPCVDLNFCYNLGSYLYVACLAENWNPGWVVPGDSEEVVGDALAPAPPLTRHASRLKGTVAWDGFIIIIFYCILDEK